MPVSSQNQPAHERRSILFAAFDSQMAAMGSGRHTVVKGIARFANRFPKFSWSSGCSGTEMYAKSLLDIRNYCEQTFMIKMDFVTLVGCDKDKDVRAWIASQFTTDTLPCFFGDLADLAKFKAQDVRTGRLERVPFASGFTCGFSCLSKTKLNRNSAQNKKCIQLGDMDESTTVTYYGAKDWMVRSRPKLTILENLTELSDVDNPADPDDKSDCEFIIKDMSASNFAALDIDIDAHDHGSWPVRVRKLFCILDGDTVGNRMILRKALDYVVAMRTQSCATTDDVLLPDNAIPQPSSIAPKEKKARVGGSDGWREEHRALFEKAGLSWPPNLEEATEIDFTFLTVGRMEEAAYLLHYAFPVLPESVGQWESVDINPTLSRVLGLGSQIKMGDDLSKVTLQRAWSSHMRTLTGSSRYLMRRQEVSGGRVQVRMLHGVEAMRAMGWDLCHYAPAAGPDSHDHDVLCTLAGRAFSSYTFSAVAMALMAAIGNYGDTDEVEVQLGRS